jgi:enoyl-CoA hydratase
MSTDKYRTQQFILAARPRTGVLQITLNRPRARNALSKKLLSEIADMLKIASEDQEIRCIVLTGDNEAFSAGADIKEMPEEGIPMFADAARLTAWKTIEQFRKPIVAAVNGYALGGGCELALLCDIVICGENAQFGTPEIKIAAFPGDGGTQRLPRLIGKARAMYMVLTGERINADMACNWGLVSEVLPLGETVNRALKIAETIAEYSPIALEMVKAEVLMSFSKPLDESLSLERQLLLWQTEDHDEGIAAFLEKRKPRYTGR